MRIKLFLITMLAILSWSAKAQLVTIPDSNFVSFLQINFPTCMTGNQMDTACTEIKTATELYVIGDSIHSISGIEYFVALRTLNCSYNKLHLIDSLPDSLTTFICDYNLLDSLPTLPDSLSYLSSVNNHLSSLPTLPIHLDTLLCSMNYITHLPALPNTLVTLSCDLNQLAYLPTLSPSLISLICNNNLLHTLPPLPLQLQILICHHNLLVLLPDLPTTLLVFDCNNNLLVEIPASISNCSGLGNCNCSGNSIAQLPAMPINLITLSCYNNIVTSLPLLPVTLTTLLCNTNLITSLPALPDALTTLNCGNNPISSLPALPAMLVNLLCNHNQLTSLPSLPSYLQSLDCSTNLISALPPLPASLDNLNCQINNLSSLPALPNFLVSLYCSSNHLTVLPTLSNSLATLNCAQNQLTTLPALPSGINQLNCSLNQLTQLPTLPNSLHSFNCSYNHISSISSFPTAIHYLNCSNNTITCFPPFSNSLTDSLSLFINPNPITCLPNYVAGMNSAILAYPICSAGNSNGCGASGGIIGYTYKDTNSNCTRDTSDLFYRNIPMKIYSAANTFLGQTYSSASGVYNFANNNSTYNVKVDTASVPFTTQCVQPGIDTTVLVATTASLVQDVNFDLVCKPGFDVGVQSMLVNGVVFPGQQHSIQITAGDMSHWYGMHCAAGISGQVKVKVSGPVSYSGITTGALIPTIGNNSYTYTINDFDLLNNSEAFGLKFTTSAFAQNGENICVNITVTPINGDNDTLNNHFHYCYHVVNSHDPNVKETYPEKVPAEYNDYFTYTIHFQNTGTAPAMNVQLTDMLDNNLDVSTFEAVNYSHPNSVSMIERKVRFDFPNIMLPDSISNAEGSKGFVQYRIKPKSGLGLGTLIHNTASIYFDFNAPIVTNTTVNEFANAADVTTLATPSSDITIYPNPNAGMFTLTTNSKQKTTIKVMNVLGESVYQAETMAAKTEIDLTKVNKGIYFIQLTDESRNVITKKVVVQ